jgi:hypothetical protein
VYATTGVRTLEFEPRRRTMRARATAFRSPQHMAQGLAPSIKNEKLTTSIAVRNHTRTVAQQCLRANSRSFLSLGAIARSMVEICATLPRNPST